MGDVISIYVARKPSVYVMQRIYKLLRAGGCEPSEKYNIRYATGEEHVRYATRRIHLVDPEATVKRNICSTKHVSRKNLTTDPQRVTCALCKRKLRQAAAIQWKGDVL